MRIGAVVVFLAVLIRFGANASPANALRIDEAHKIADTRFFALLQAGDFTNPDWFRHPADRANPPIGKYLFGTAARLEGAPLAESLRIRQELPDGTLGQELQPGELARYRDTLRAARHVSLVAIALTAALLFLAAARAFGWIAAIIATVFFSECYLVPMLADSAVYDALLTLAVFGTLTFVQNLDTPAPPRRRDVIAIGLLGAIAFEIRASGAIAIVLASGVFVALALIRRNAADLRALAAMLGIAFVVATLVNPFYWAAQRPDKPLPLRIVSRYAQQFSDLRMLAAVEMRKQGTLPLSGKARFAAEVLFGDVGGMAMLVGLLLLPLRALRRTELSPLAHITLAWCAALAIAITLWLPFAWPRYVLLIVPPLALLSAAGWTALSLVWGRALRPPRGGRSDRLHT